MKKQIINVGICLVLAFTTLHCAKKTTTSQASTTDQSQTSTSAASSSTSASTEAADLNVYAGKYKMQSDQVGMITITVENNKIYGEAEGQPKTEIKPEGRDSFNVPDFNAKVIFSRDSNQKVSGLTLYINGGEVSGDKVE
ncbi:DUF3471 domain-containing protein [Rhodocytophaga rosea]|uniref:DUF3471 domain-containing protein n=1 Tax=Rhodocytophaga rosea TaxID=2704465 RepID=A0A6C0GKF3_9BACT|nr:DUF3471 domain-containing protein [Rhodocytophaga rosea]QHT68427.1 DUF3471 domain-containing protein [Rhodocytophaga rosea]